MLSKTLALAIAIVLFVELLRDKRPRYLVSLCAGCWMLVLLLLTHPPAVLEALSLHSFLTPRFWFAHGGVTELNVGINWSTMFFLTGMMVLVEGMGEAGFFDWVSLRLARALGFRPMAILLSFMILAALLASRRCHPHYRETSRHRCSRIRGRWVCPLSSPSIPRS